MAYDRLDLKTGDELNEAVFKKIDDNFEKSVIQENNYNLTTSTDLLKDSFEYWKPYYSTAIRGFEQNFLTNKNEILLETVHRTTIATGNYISSPVIKVNTALDNTLIIDNTNIFVRHFYIFNENGEVLFHIGNQIATNPTYFSGGLSSSGLAAFIAEESNVSAYPLICSALQANSIPLNCAMLKELNALFQSGLLGTIKTYHTMGTYVENEPVWIHYSLKTGIDRPDSEEEYSNWLRSTISDIKLNEVVTEEVYENPRLAISSDVAEKFYESPRLNDVMNEIGEFKEALAIENKTLITKKKEVIYSELTMENFFPAHYIGYRLSSTSCAISDFSTPTYTKVVEAGSKDYKITKPIPLDVNENSTYEITGAARHFVFLDANGKNLYGGESGTNLKITVDYFESAGIDPKQVKWFVCSNKISNFNESWKITNIITTTYYSFNMPSLALTEDQLGGVDLSGVGDGYKTVDLTNVDRIVTIGDSYTESFYTIKDKAWLSKVSLLSDYNYDNFAISGDTFRGQLNKIRTGAYSYAKTSKMTWEKLHPTHTILISKTNDTKYMDAQQYIYDMVAAIETTKGLGAIPIIASEHHVSSQDYTQTAFDFYAKKYGGYYVDLTEKTYTLRGTDHKPFWGGSHPGTRTNHLYSDVFTKYINENLPRPYSSIKIFRPRDNSLVSNLDNYLFHGIEERAEKFKEISICHSALNDSSLYDTCTNQSGTKYESEYFKLMAGLSVEFDKMCLIDVILPSTVHDISEVKLITNTLSGVNCYVKDVIAEPYPSPAFCRRFDIAEVLDSTRVAVGNKYTSDKSTGVTYTVVEIIYDQVESDDGFVDGTILICSGNKSVTQYNESTLTLTSGTGDATLHCTYEAVGLSSDYPAGKQDIGHYVLLEEYGVVKDSTLKRALDYDKITFLLVGDSTFNLKDVQVKFKGNITKQRDTLAYRNNLQLTTGTKTSKLSYTKFDNDSVAHWIKNDSSVCGLTPTTPVDSVLPKNISKIVTLTPDDGTIAQSITVSGITDETTSSNYKVKVWARYFPDIFDPTTMTYPDDSAITDDSFDWAKLAVKLYDSNDSLQKDSSIKMQKLVGLHWTELEVDITLPPVAKTWYIGLEAIDKPIQLAYCDVI